MPDTNSAMTAARVCVKCGYSLEGLASEDRVCPECGAKNAHAGVRRCPGCYTLLEQPAPLRCHECDAPTGPPPRHCVRCRYDLLGICDPRRVCPECGLDNSPSCIEAMARRMRRELVWLRVPLWVGVAGAFACLVGGHWLVKHWQYYAGARSRLPHWLDEALLVLMGVFICMSSVSYAHVLTVRSRAVKGRPDRREWWLGALIGLAASSVVIVVMKMMGLL